MNAIRHRLVLTALTWVTVAAAGVAHAGVHVSVRFGTYIGGCAPRHGWHSSWHRHRRCGPMYAGYWRVYEPLWVHRWDPIFVVPPAVVEKRVVVERPVSTQPVDETHSAVVSQAQQRTRREMLERLRIGDEDNRVQAVQETAGFVGDEKVREALERVLLSDRDAGVRAAAARALVKQSGSRAVPALKQAYADDASRQVSQAAYRALIMIDGY